MAAGGRRTIDLTLLKRAISKKLTGRLRYRTPAGYDAKRYWTDRFDKYGTSLRGAGHEGLSEEANEEMYLEAARVFEATIRRLLSKHDGTRALEIGCGTGFYTDLLKRVGVAEFTGIDITDALFAEHRERFPGFRFVQADVTKDPLEGTYDLAVMIDVTEHIVTRDDLDSAFSNIANVLVPGGYFIVGPQFEQSRRHLFYVHFWSVDDVRSAFPDWDEVANEDFRDGRLLVFRKPG